MDTHTALQKRVKEKFLTHVHSRRVLPIRFPCALLLTTSEDSFALRNGWVYHWITTRSASRETCTNLLVATHAKCVQLSFDSDFLNILNGLYCSWRWIMIRTQKWSLRLNKNWSRGGDSEKIEKSCTAAGIEPGTTRVLVYGLIHSPRVPSASWESAFDVHALPCSGIPWNPDGNCLHA